MTYRAPVADIAFALRHSAGFSAALGEGLFGELSEEAVEAVLAEAGRFAADIIAPLNAQGDRAGTLFKDGAVTMPPGWKEAYRAWAQGGWPGLAAPAQWGGQELPHAVNVACMEMWNSAAMAFALGPLLTMAGVDALIAHGSDELKRVYLPKLVSGEWMGTMQLTEPQAGSDVGALRARAERAADGSYRITGQKIFITYGDHDLAPNIIHMVLARTPDAPPGSRGISLFLVPKFLLDAEGGPGQRNDVRTLSLEHKLGIHASPTCVLSYEDAIGWRIGDKNRGLECMFTMMNAARLNVGVQGLAIAERAYQQAVEFARTRVQGQPLGIARAVEGLPIIYHPDVRRMLLWMRAATEAMRGLAYYAAAMIDRSRCHPEAAERLAAQRRADLLIPVVKAWCSDLGVAVASIGIQVHGGMGYVEETGAAQYLRDARIAPIYEGTNGIQANDLVGRKLTRDHGEVVTALIKEMRQAAAALGRHAIAGTFDQGLAALEAATAYLVEADDAQAAAGSVPYLTMLGTVAAGWLMARQALAAERNLATNGKDRAFLAAKLATARFYGEHFLVQAPGYLAGVTSGSTVIEFDPARF